MKIISPNNQNRGTFGMMLEVEKIKPFHSKDESYKHLLAKWLLGVWIRSDYLRIEFEAQFIMGGQIFFIPDIVCYNENGICAVWEVSHKSEMTAKRLVRMQYYQYINEVSFKIYEVEAEYILRQVKKPDKIRKIDMS